MPRKAFIMSVNPDQHDEYERRHDEIWPELERVFVAYGVRSHSVFLQEETHQLFAYIEYDSEEQMDAVAQTPEVQRWWKYMADIMPANPDNSPKSVMLREVYCFRAP